MQSLWFFLAIVFVCTTLPCFAKEPDWQKTLSSGYHELAVGNTNHAVAIFSKKVNKYPSSAICHTALGRAYKRLGKIDQAKAEFHQATQLEPDFPDGFYELGVIEEGDKNWGAATAAFERYMQLNPSVGARENVPDRIRFCQGHLSPSTLSNSSPE